MKKEIWNNHEIRFVSKDGEWWAVAKDVATALGYKKPENAVASHVSSIDKTTTLIQGTGSNYKSKAILISEFGIYDLVFSAKMKEAKEFKRWVFDVIKQLRHSAGLEGFEVFRMLDKEHQKEAMSKLSNSLAEPAREHFIIANVIANKAVSSKYGFEKSLKKKEMLPEMLIDRQAILEDTTQLIAVKEKFGLSLSVSNEVYSKVLGKAHADVS